MAFYKSKYTGAQIDQRLAQGTYDDAVQHGFNGTKDEFDVIITAYNKDEKELVHNAQQKVDTGLETEHKTIVGAINEIHEELDLKQPVGDYANKGEFEVFKDEVAATYATIEQIPDISNLATKSELSNKQDNLISGTTIKTINGESLLGSGNIEISGGISNITGENIQNKPTFATVATSGSYNDLIDVPSLSEYVTESQLNSKGYLTSSSLNDYQTIQDDSLNTDAKNIPEAINEINSQLPIYIQIPELTEDYIIPDNETIREYTYEIPIGETTHNILLSSNAKGNNDFAPIVSANKTYIVSIIKNFAVGGEF